MLDKKNQLEININNASSKLSLKAFRVKLLFEILIII